MFIKKKLFKFLSLVLFILVLVGGFTYSVSKVHAISINTITKTDVTPGIQPGTFTGVPVYRLHVFNTGDADDYVDTLYPTPSGSVVDTLVTLHFYNDANDNGIVDGDTDLLPGGVLIGSDNTGQTVDITNVLVPFGGSANILITADGALLANAGQFYLSIASTANVVMTGTAVGGSATGANLNALTIDAVAPILVASDIVVDNSQQPNKIILTFNEPLEPVQAAIYGNYVVRNNSYSATYSFTNASLSNLNKTVTLTLATLDPAAVQTFITNADITAGIKVTPSATNIKDVAFNVYAGGEKTAVGATNIPDSTPATVSATLVRTNATTYKVIFNEKVDKTTSETITNYPLAGSTCAAAVGNALTATLQTNGTDVVITTPDTSACISGDTVIVTPTTGITDVAGVAITPSAATYTFTLPAQSGSPNLTAGTPPTYDTQLTVGPGTLGVQTNLTYTWYRSADAAIGSDTLLGTGTTYTPVSLDIGNYLIVIATTPDAPGDGSLITGGMVVKATPTATLAVSNSPQDYTGVAQGATVGITAFSVLGAVENILTGGAATQTNAGTHAVTANFVPTDTTNYNTLTALSAGNFIINKVNTTASFTVTPSKPYDQSTSVTTLSQTPNSILIGDTVTLDGGLANYADPNAAIGITVSLVGATLNGAQAGNYNLTTVTDTTADITKIQLNHTTPTITLSRIYDGGTTATITAAGTLIGVLGSEDVTVNEVATYDNKDVGKGKIITVVYILAGVDKDNYIKPVDDTTTVTGVISRRPSTYHSSGGSVSYIPPVPPLIDVVKVPSPLALPTGPGAVTYTYTLKNIGTVSVTNVTMFDDSCISSVLISGDTNADSKLDVTETWIYKCSTTLSKTHTNIVTATGWANGISTTDIASATVVVGASIVPPLIHVTKVPSPPALLTGGGEVIYKYTVINPGIIPLSNVSIVDDKCTGLPGRVVGHPGDLNKNNLLESNESWSFTCKSNIFETTSNTVTVSGEANGLTAKDFAIATVIVGVLKLPKTGLPPQSNFGQQIKTITSSLEKGEKNNKVTILQQFLISEDKGPYAKELAKVGATSYFGILTRRALAEFQTKTDINPPLGNFGPITRAYIIANY